jgi:phenylpropionate dioxygenase-like ring-hydroxylating dioxygenase large terminal subunit
VPRGEVMTAQYHFLWPNTTIDIVPGPVNIAMERWVPTGLRTTVEVTDYFFAEDATEEQVQEIIAFGTQVGIEDQGLCESVQEELESGLVPQGRLMLQSEQLIHDFQRKVVAALHG